MTNKIKSLKQLPWSMFHRWNGWLFILLRKSWEDCLYLMNKVNTITNSADTFELEAIVKSQDMTTSGMICCPCPLSDTLKYSKLVRCTWLHFCGIGCQYSGKIEAWFPILEEYWAVIKMSINNFLEVASKPNIRMLTSPKPGNDHAHGLELRISFEKCAVDATDTIYKKIWESGAWMVVVHGNNNF